MPTNFFRPSNLRKAYNLFNLRDGNTLASSINAPGGLFNRSLPGTATAALGSALNLPEFGISERLAEATRFGSFEPAPTTTPAPSSTPSNPDTTDPYTLPPAGTGTGSGTGGGTRQAYTPQYVQLPNGQVFDVNDPTQRVAFFDARNALINAQIEQQYNVFAQQQQQALREAEEQYARALEGNQYDLGQLNQQLEDYNLQNERQIGDVGQAYDIGSVRRQNAFAQASPLAYQSSQGTSQQFALGQRDQALSDINRATEQTRGNFARQEGELARERGDLGTDYQSYLQRVQQGLQQYRQSLMDQAAGQRSSLAGDLSELDVNQGINQFRYNRQSAGPLSTVSTDLSQYTPYLNFESLQQSPSYNYFQSFKPTATNNLKPVESYLGYNPTTKQKDPVNAFLRG